MILGWHIITIERNILKSVWVDKNKNKQWQNIKVKSQNMKNNQIALLGQMYSYWKSSNNLNRWLNR